MYDKKDITVELATSGNDFCAARIVAYVKKGHRILPIGTMRVRFFSDFVKFERMAVTKNYRKTGISEDIMLYGMRYAAEKGYRQVYGMCKKELLPRWQQCGYQEIKDVPHVQQNGMELIPIKLELPVPSQNIKMTSAPELLTALEGHWFDEERKETPQNHSVAARAGRLVQLRDGRGAERKPETVPAHARRRGLGIPQRCRLRPYG